MSQHFLDLAGQTAVVTGAATGIGEAIARRLAEAGAFVVIGDIDEAAARATAATLPSGEAARLDVTSAASIASVVEAVLTKTGRIDIWVNNAGIAGKAAPVTEYDEGEFRRVMDLLVA